MKKFDSGDRLDKISLFSLFEELSLRILGVRLQELLFFIVKDGILMMLLKCNLIRFFID